MRKKNTILGMIIFATLLSLTACQKAGYEYKPTGEFYTKTSPAHGDAGASKVISLEALYKTYEGEGDITVPFTVGFGHLSPGVEKELSAKDTFCLVYRVFDGPWTKDQVPAWEKKVEYTDYWDDSKYNATEPMNRSFLMIPLYGDFYPLYTEQVDVVFPEEVESGYLEVGLLIYNEGADKPHFYMTLEVDFQRVNGVLILEPSN